MIGGGVAKAALGPTKELERIYADIEPIQDKLNANQAKFAQQQEEINELLRVQPYLEGQTSKKIKQTAEARAQAGEALSTNKRKIRDLQASQRGLTLAAKGYQSEIDKANAAATKQNNIIARRNLLLKKGKKLASGFQGGAANLRSAVLGAGAGLGARAAFNAASQKESAGVRVEVLEQEFNQLIGIQEAAARSAEKFILSETQVLQSYINLGNRLGEQGATVADLENVYDGLNTVLVKNRASTQEAASATLQLNQALGSGRLAGEEFRAVNEAAPQVITEVARVLKVQRGEVKKLAADGKVSSKVLIQALTNIKKNGADSLEEGFTGAFGAVRRFDKAIREFSEAVGAQLLPAITPIIEGLTKVLEAFGKLDPRIQTAIVGFTALAIAVLAVAPAAIAVTKALVSVASVFGALKLGAAAVGMTKLALATKGLGAAAAFALGPWGLLAAGIAVAGVVIGKAVIKQREYNEVINGAEFQQKKFNDILYEKKKRLEEAKAKLKELEEKGKGFEKRTAAQAKEVERLQKELTNLQGTYKVRIQIQTRFEDALAAKGQRMGPDGLEVRIGDKWYDKNNKVVEVIEQQKPDVGLSSLSSDSSSGSGSSSGSKRESRVPELTREKDLQTQLNDLNRKQLEAQLAENAALVEALEGAKLQLQYEKDIADIQANKELPDDEKLIEKELRRLQLVQDQDNLIGQQNERLKQEQQLINDTIEPLEKQRRLLDEQLAGRGEEEEILQEIEGIMKDLPKKERGRVEALVRGNKEREKELEKMREIEEFQKQIADRIKSGLEDALVGTLDAAIDKTKDLGEELQKIASSLLKDLGRMFLRAGINGLGGLTGLPGFAEGGYVTGPTPALVGEGGEPEFVIPQSKMNGAMLRWGRGQTGNQVLADGGEMGGGGSALADQPPQINISGGVMQVGGEDYVRMDQIPTIIAQSAKAGEAKALRSLQMSPSARRMAGV